MYWSACLQTLKVPRQHFNPAHCPPPHSRNRTRLFPNAHTNIKRETLKLSSSPLRFCQELSAAAAAGAILLTLFFPQTHFHVKSMCSSLNSTKVKKHFKFRRKAYPRALSWVNQWVTQFKWFFKSFKDKCICVYEKPHPISSEKLFSLT